MLSYSEIRKSRLVCSSQAFRIGCELHKKEMGTYLKISIPFLKSLISRNKEIKPFYNTIKITRGNILCDRLYERKIL